MAARRDRVKLLVEALRSGAYVQGSGILRRTMPDGTKQHCCLGVACEIAIANGLVVDAIKSTDTAYGDTFDGLDAVLPTSVMEWYGFPTADPVVSWPYVIEDDKPVRISASMLNDCGTDGYHAGGTPLNFEQIAEAFEYTFLETEENENG